MTSKPKKQNKDAFTTKLAVDFTRFLIFFKNKKVIKLIKNTFYYRLTICTHYLQSCTKSTTGFLWWESNGKHRGLLNIREAQSVMWGGRLTFFPSLKVHMKYILLPDLDVSNHVSGRGSPMELEFFSIGLVCFSPCMRCPWPLSQDEAGGWPDAQCHPDWAVWGSAHNPENKKEEEINHGSVNS